tara:strand:- start:59 stop:457 length:399 start_codon:yes stop_codon:yes gene_type:complete
MENSHSEHNKEACDYLFASGKFNDWVVTTAFYSALHFVHSEVFPLTTNEGTFKCFDSYFNFLNKRGSNSLNKHTATIRLVEQHLKHASSQYRYLYDQCMSARYSNFKVSLLMANQAKITLESLLKVKVKPKL